MYSGERDTIISYFIYTALVFAGTGIQESTTQLFSTWPWMAALFYNSPNGSTTYGRGGSLIADQWILTVGHCASITMSHVRLGDLHINATPSADAIDIKVQNQIVHPYYQTFLNSLKYDIALLYLSQPVEFTNKIYPICLTQNDDIYNAQVVYVSGWGHTGVCKSGFASYICKINYARCPGNQGNNGVDGPTPPEISDRVLCAIGVDGAGSCTGDSESALVFRDEKNDLRFQGGIVSFNCGCGDPKWPGGYTRVTSYMDWIERMMTPAPPRDKISSTEL